MSVKDSKDLLYDPMFAKKPPKGWEDSEKGGIFGKAITKKIIFILFLVVAIGASLALSFSAIGKDKYSYEDTENGCQLSEFNGGDNDIVLDVEFVNNEDGSIDTSKPVESVRNYAVCCNEKLRFIYIGKDVKNLEYNCFYYCNNLLAIIVDPQNKNFVSVDGVLYNKKMTEIIIHPIKNNEYRASLAMGYKAPSTKEECADFAETFNSKFGLVEEERSEDLSKSITELGGKYEIADTVTKIAPFCFNYCSGLTYVKIPDGVKELGEMAFFKCTGLETIYLPDGLESIGADGVSYCEKLTYIYVPASVKTIGHHAFYGCLGCDKIYLGAANKDAVKTGESWLPKLSDRSLKNAEAVYGAKREVK